MVVTLFERFFRRNGPGDLPLPAPAALADDDTASAATETGGRRDRALDSGEDVLAAKIAEKVLHGWLQNRNQTLYPMTVNLRTVDDGGRMILARFIAVALLAGPRQDGAVSEAEHGLAAAGADEPMLQEFRAALQVPPALDAALAAILDGKLAAYAYVGALVAMDARDAASRHFLDYLAERLSLPTTLVRSANRRYRR